MRYCLKLPLGRGIVRNYLRVEELFEITSRMRCCWSYLWGEDLLEITSRVRCCLKWPLGWGIVGNNLWVLEITSRTRCCLKLTQWWGIVGNNLWDEELLEIILMLGNIRNYLGMTNCLKLPWAEFFMRYVIPFEKSWHLEVDIWKGIITWTLCRGSMFQSNYY